MSVHHKHTTNNDFVASTDRPQDAPSQRTINRPKLLVSVRSADEARIAIQGGAEILDVKEPKLGSLGMASIETIEAITRLPDLKSKPLSLSVALGETTDWIRSKVIPSLPKGIKYAKLGLSGCRNDRDWVRQWKRVRLEFELRTESRLKWVAVIYADALNADSPEFEEILSTGIESNCAGVLIDTWSKARGGLLDYVNTSQLDAIAAKCRSAGLFFAIAGQLNFESLSHLAEAHADLLAIRSAACREGDRTKELDPNRIEQFLEQMNLTFQRRKKMDSLHPSI